MLGIEVGISCYRCQQCGADLRLSLTMTKSSAKSARSGAPMSRGWL